MFVSITSVHRQSFPSFCVLVLLVNIYRYKDNFCDTLSKPLTWLTFKKKNTTRFHLPGNNVQKLQ